MSHKRGFCGIGVYHAKHSCNVGTLFRSAYAFGADFIFTVGRNYSRQASDTVSSTRHLPYYGFTDLNELQEHGPRHARLVCIEITDQARNLVNFIHPEQAIYLLGSEGGGLPEKILKNNLTISIPTSVCLNVAVAGSIVLYDRLTKHKPITKF